MATDIRTGRDLNPSAPRIGRHAEALASTTASITRALAARAQRMAASRRARPWLAMVGIPLAVPAALLTEHWWALVPLWFCAWWWAPRDWGWEWLQSFEASLVGTEWAAIGAFSLGGFPEHRVVIGTVWLAVPMVFAIVFAQRRRP